MWLNTLLGNSNKIADDRPHEDVEQSAVRWYGPGESVRLANLEINGGLVYVGLPPSADADNGKHFIDPSLSVSETDPDFSGQTLDFWPNYLTMHPRARLAYISWLADGRRRADIHPSYVLLFLYGIERRLILEHNIDEASTILHEVSRIAEAYGHHHGIKKAVAELTDAAELILTGNITQRTGTWRRNATLPPLCVKLALGQSIRNATPFRPDDLFSWVLQSSERSFELPPTEQIENFHQFFCQMLSRVRPTGVVFQDNGGKRLTHEYRSASDDFRFELDSFLPDVPDITDMPQVWSEAHALVRQASERFKLRKPSKPGATHPNSFLAGTEIRHVEEVVKPRTGKKAVQEWAQQRLAGNRHISVRAALKRLRGLLPNHLERREIIRLADILSKVSIGLVPDPRFDIAPERVSEDAILFSLDDPDSASNPPSLLYREIFLVVTACMSVARSDGEIAAVELDYTNDIIANTPGLDADDRARLTTEVEWMNLYPLPLEPLLQNLARLDQQAKQRIADIIIEVALIDEKTPEAEVTFVTAIFAAVDLSDHAVLEKITTSGSAPSADVSSQQATAIEPVSEESSGLDEIDQILKNLHGPDEDCDDDSRGAKVSSSNTLNSIDQEAGFSEEFETALHSAKERTEFTLESVREETLCSSHDGLDAKHSRFLTRLVAQSEWSAKRLDQLARQHGLMASGAIETINDWMFSELYDCLLEVADDGSFKLNPDIDLETLGVAA